MEKDSSDSSSLEFHDVSETPVETSTPSTKKKRSKFKSLSLRRQKSSSIDDGGPVVNKSNTLPLKKRRSSLTRILSFGKKNKDTVYEQGSSEFVSRDTLCIDLENQTPNEPSETVEKTGFLRKDPTPPKPSKGRKKSKEKAENLGKSTETIDESFETSSLDSPAKTIKADGVSSKLKDAVTSPKTFFGTKKKYKISPVDDEKIREDGKYHPKAEKSLLFGIKKKLPVTTDDVGRSRETLSEDVAVEDSPKVVQNSFEKELAEHRFSSTPKDCQLGRRDEKDIIGRSRKIIQDHQELHTALVESYEDVDSTDKNTLGENLNKSTETITEDFDVSSIDSPAVQREEESVSVVEDREKLEKGSVNIVTTSKGFSFWGKKKNHSSAVDIGRSVETITEDLDSSSISSPVVQRVGEPASVVENSESDQKLEKVSKGFSFGAKKKAQKSAVDIGRSIETITEDLDSSSVGSPVVQRVEVSSSVVENSESVQKLEKVSKGFSFGAKKKTPKPAADIRRSSETITEEFETSSIDSLKVSKRADTKKSSGLLFKVKKKTLRKGSVGDDETSSQDSREVSLKDEKIKASPRSLFFGLKWKRNVKGELEHQGVSEVDTPTKPVPVLRNVLRTSSVIELVSETKKSEGADQDVESSDSFKSAGSPELRNAQEETSVESVLQGSCDHPDPTEPSYDDSDIFLFHDSNLSRELQPSESKKSLWKRLVYRERLIVYSKTSADLAQVDGAMSQNQGAVRKEKARGRAASVRKSERDSTSPAKEEEPEKAQTQPTLSKPPASPTSPTLDEETLRKTAEVATQILQQKKEEEKRVTGDDLRKQLTEGLKNGSGKNGAGKVKSQVLEITQSAAETSATETQNFIAKERSREKTEEASKESEKKEDRREKTKTGKEELPGTSSEAGSSTESVEKERIDMPPPEGKREHLYKILVIGELGTGKTSIIKRYVHQFFSQHYRATIGVDFALKVLNWDENTIVRLQLWDIAGQERFGNMTRVYYKEAVGAFIVFDVTRAATFDAVLKWKQDLDSKVQLSDGSPIPCMLLANKCDQPKEGIVNNKGKMDEYCKEKGFSGWFETSAKENINIEEAAKSLVLKILQNDKLIRNERNDDADKIALDSRSDSSAGKSCSC